MGHLAPEKYTGTYTWITETSMADLTKLIQYSETPGFHNRRQITGSFILPTGAVYSPGGVMFRDFIIPLITAPDIIEIQYNAPMETPGGLVSNRWVYGADLFAGYYVPQNVNVASGGTDTLPWNFTSEIIGTDLVVHAFCIMTYLDSWTTTQNVTINYRIIDYSAL